MKKTIITLSLSLCLCLVFCGCVWKTSENKDKNVPEGYITYKKYLDRERWMDWTDYCCYDYGKSAKVELPENYRPLCEKDYILTVKRDVEEFIKWMREAKRESELTFSEDDITENDYAYIVQERVNSTIEMYYFDSDTNVLHYMFTKW